MTHLLFLISTHKCELYPLPHIPLSKKRHLIYIYSVLAEEEKMFLQLGITIISILYVCIIHFKVCYYGMIKCLITHYNNYVCGHVYILKCQSLYIDIYISQYVYTCVPITSMSFLFHKHSLVMCIGFANIVLCFVTIALLFIYMFCYHCILFIYIFCHHFIVCLFISFAIYDFLCLAVSQLIIFTCSLKE